MPLTQHHLSDPGLLTAHPSRDVWVNRYVIIIAVITVCVAYLDLAGYYHALSDGVFLPKYAYYGLAVAIVPILVLRSQTLGRYLNSRFILWAAAMLFLNLLYCLFSAVNGNDQAASLTLTRAQYIILAALLGFVLVNVRPLLLSRILAALAIVLAALQVVDFFAPGTVVPLGAAGAVLGRAGSTLVNANKASESILLLTLLGMAGLRPVWRVWFLLLVLPGVFLTFSRSGLLAWLIVVVGCFWFRVFQRSALLVMMLVVPLVLLVANAVIGLVITSVDSGAVSNLSSRILFLSNFDISDFSAQERLAAASYAFKSFLAHPLFGAGAGYYYWSGIGVGPHNQHLMMLAEYGLIGYALFLWVIVLVYRGGVYFKDLNAFGLGKVAFLLVLVFTPFTHNMFDNLYWFVTFAILCQCSMNGRR